jgi:hypothetical protein
VQLRAPRVRQVHALAIKSDTMTAVMLVLRTFLRLAIDVGFDNKAEHGIWS